jgi:flavin-dependent dehydrogenase
VQPVDVLIVGGGPAGIASALFLAHAAPQLTDRILVLEKERYPREKFCAGAVGARALTLLASIGVTLSSPSVSISSIALRALGETRVVRGHDIGRVVRRIEFDAELAQVARSRGIRVLDGVRVTGLAMSSPTLSVETSAGVLRPRVVIGADGVGSFVRRALGYAAAPYNAQALEVDTELAPGDLPRDVLLFDVSNHALPGYYWEFPTLVDGREMMCRGVYLLRDVPGAAGVEIQDVLAAELAARGLDLSRCKKKRFAERGFDTRAALARPGVLLVGEAAGIDPVTGEGIAQAIQYGAVAGRYIARKWRARDFEFADWRAEVRGSMLGRDLLTRTLGLPIFYSDKRPTIERFLLDTPDFVRVGMQHFAGQPWSKRALARAAWSAARHTARWALRGNAGLSVANSEKESLLGGVSRGV